MFLLSFYFLHLQRQFSSPDTFPCKSPCARHVYIQLSNVTGFQNGNNNTMHIYGADLSERRRHPTAPSSVNLPPPHPGNWKDKTGGAGWVHMGPCLVFFYRSEFGLSCITEQEGHVLKEGGIFFIFFLNLLCICFSNLSRIQMSF